VTERAASAARPVHAGGSRRAPLRAPAPPAGRSSRALEIEQTLLHLKGLVFARAILEDRGASALELAEHTAELERQRRHLAELVRDFRPFLAHAHADLNRGC
jgi:hypothetical protein